MKGISLILAVVSFSASVAAGLLTVKLTQNKFLGTGAVRFGLGCPPTYFIGAIDIFSRSKFFNLSIPRTTCQSGYSHSSAADEFTDLATLVAPSANITFPLFVINIFQPHLIPQQPGQNYLFIDPATTNKGVGICQNSTVGGMGFYHTPAAIPSIIGSVTFCGTDTSQYCGNLKFVPKVLFSNNVAMPLIKYGNITITPTVAPPDSDLSKELAALIMPPVPDIVLTNYQFQAYVNATGATDHNDGNGYVLTRAQFANLKNLTITLGTCPHDPIRIAISGPPDPAVDANIPIGYVSLGNTFLERFYVYLDVDRQRVGFGITRHTYQKINY